MAESRAAFEKQRYQTLQDQQACLAQDLTVSRAGAGWSTSAATRHSPRSCLRPRLRRAAKIWIVASSKIATGKLPRPEAKKPIVLPNAMVGNLDQGAHRHEEIGAGMAAVWEISTRATIAGVTQMQ